jgi:hypothetical protein
MEPAKIWWVTADAGVIEVAVHDRRLPDDRLALAAAVYGLSPAQARVARAIVAGQDLSAAAAELGIRLNTARERRRRGAGDSFEHRAHSSAAAVRQNRSPQSDRSGACAAYRRHAGVRASVVHAGYITDHDLA